MKYLYAGTDEFSSEVLKHLLENYSPPVAVLTQKPKPKGRGLKISPSPVSVAASERGIEVVEIERFSEIEDDFFKSRDLDALVVCSFGLYIPSWFLEKFKWTLNLHPSLVPEFRGAAPIQRALLEGKTETGVSIIEVSPEMDAGKVYASVRVPIMLSDDYATLSKRLIEKGASLLVKIMRDVENGRVALKEQVGEVTYAKKISKEELYIDWSKEALQIHNQVRAFSPKPGARTFFRGKMLKVLKSEPIDGGGGKPGRIEEVGKDFLLVGTGKGLLKILSLQPENSRVLTAEEFVNGYRPQAGEILMQKK